MDEGRVGDKNLLSDVMTRFRRWLDQPDDHAASVLDVICALDADDVRSLVITAPDVFGRRGIRLILERANALIGDSPRSAAKLARVAIHVAGQLWSPRPEEDVGLLGDAWKELGSALLSAGDWSDAAEACDNAALYYSVVAPLRSFESSILALIQGQVLHELGRSDEGLALIERHANLLLAFYGNRQKYVEARTIYAVILLKRQEYPRALRALDESAQIAAEEKDTEVLAYILNNIGLCWINLGNLPKAKECLTTAAEMFADQHLRTESVRVRGSLALLLVQLGKYNEAISEYYICRSTLLELGLPIPAAQAGLRVVEVLFLAGRTSQVSSLCAELVRTFTDAKLPRSAQEALSYLTSLAATNTADENAVRSVREFFARLEIEPEAEFKPVRNEG